MAQDLDPIGIGSGPPAFSFAVTPNDNADLQALSHFIFVAVSGDLAVVMSSGDAVTFKAVQAGVLHPIRVARVKATGTTATGILAFY